MKTIIHQLNHQLQPKRMCYISEFLDCWAGEYYYYFPFVILLMYWLSENTQNLTLNHE